MEKPRIGLERSRTDLDVHTKELERLRTVLEEYRTDLKRCSVDLEENRIELERSRIDLQEVSKGFRRFGECSKRSTQHSKVSSREF